jgi:sensor histidine kinase regulating citrate/malate metabolism
LANAIDACEKVEAPEKSINVIFRLDTHLDIRIDNPYVEVLVPQKSGRFKSTKKTPGHGLGMESIEEAVNRYDGNIETVIENGIFSLRIMLQQIKPPELAMAGPIAQRAVYGDLADMDINS